MAVTNATARKWLCVLIVLSCNRTKTPQNRNILFRLKSDIFKLLHWIMFLLARNNLLKFWRDKVFSK